MIRGTFKITLLISKLHSQNYKTWTREDLFVKISTEFSLNLDPKLFNKTLTKVLVHIDHRLDFFCTVMDMAFEKLVELPVNYSISFKNNILAMI